MHPRRTVVVKIGSNSLVDDAGRLDRPFLGRIVAQLVAAQRAGWDPIVVTSGAVAAGVARLGLSERPPGLPARQALAAIGQIDLVHLWREAFARHEVAVAQLLLTYDDFTHRTRYLNLTATLRALAGFGAVPVINENDPVAVEELTVGDNDRLSALVAVLAGASRLVLLTDIDGMYDADPRHDPKARLIAEIPAISAQHIAAAGGAGARGRGGMRSKVEAARLAGGAGAVTHIAKAREADIITRLLADEQVGTRILATGHGRGDAHRRWLAARQVKGRIAVDAGAARALAAQGRSLLPAGVVRIDGAFARGDTVAVLGPDGDELARGLAAMSSAELARVAGRKKTSAITGDDGQPLPDTAIHRDDLILLGA